MPETIKQCRDYFHSLQGVDSKILIELRLRSKNFPWITRYFGKDIDDGPFDIRPGQRGCISILLSIAADFTDGIHGVAPTTQAISARFRLCYCHSGRSQPT